MVGRHRGSAGKRRWGVLTGVLVLAAVVTVATPPVARRLGLPLPWAAADQSCARTAITLAVAPEAVPAVEEILRPLQGRPLADGHCLTAAVQNVAPAAFVASAALLPPDRAAQIWIPDSSLWTRQVQRLPLQQESALASSPLVVATSPAAVAKLGWAAKPPSWAQALSGVRPVAMPDLQSNAAGLVAILALWQSLGKGQAADQAVAAAVLAASRSTAPTAQAALAAAADNDPDAPLLATSEIAVFNANRGSDSPRLVAVYPSDGSPALDYPVLRVAPEAQGATRTAAVNAVLTALAADSARAVVRRNGLRDGNGAGPAGSGVRAGTVSTLTVPGAAETTSFLDRLQQLQVPSRILTVMDVSLSMRTLVPGTQFTRVALAGQAAVSAGDLLSDRSSAGLWVFALALDGTLPYQQLSPLAPLGASENGVPHRTRLDKELAGLSSHLSGGGTALYATTLAAMRAMQAGYDPSAVNSVVLFTDGTNENDPSTTLDQVVTELKKLHDPKKPVRLIAIGIGPTADLPALQEMVAPTGGKAYRATTADELRTVLFDSLARR